MTFRQLCAVACLVIEITCCVQFYNSSYVTKRLCIVCFVSFCVLLVCKCVLNYCHRVATQLQLINISSYQQYTVGYVQRKRRSTIGRRSTRVRMSS
jgi:hypothetical protein